ncbi:proline dehydrogenase family protein [Paenibacillus chungangensis]|uniref:proline dehydrogenase n=1 Tax=Paenibacillus chungangensis TaxID=696535 RepID=A0ABW3HRD9_9BACL
MMEALLRKLLLAAGRNAALSRLMRKHGMRLGARRYVAGTGLSEAIATVRRLNGEGKLATLDHLGEYAGSARDAARAAEMCLKTLDALHHSGVDGNLSLKLTSLGLDLDMTACENYMRAILQRAAEYGIFVRIDMEDSKRCERTLRLYDKLSGEFPGVGVVIQAYLRRSPEDLKALGCHGANVRLVKGAYKEPPDVAYPDKRDVDSAYLRLAMTHLSSEGYTAIATHDEILIGHARDWIAQQGIPDNRYEYQMLYGIGEELQNRLVKDGCKVRVYVPFGEDWFGYFMRRLAERPANLWFVLKHWRK